MPRAWSRHLTGWCGSSSDWPSCSPSVPFLLAPSWTAGLLRVGVAVAVAVLIGWFAVHAIADAVAQAARTPEGQKAVADIAGAVIHSLQPLATVLILVGLVVALAAFVFDRRAVEVAA